MKLHRGFPRHYAAVAACAVALFASANASSQILEGGIAAYGTLGVSQTSYSDLGIGLKLGADFGKDMFGVENLGLTAFVAHTGGKEDSSGCDRKVSNNSLAAGATYSYAMEGTAWTFQGRAYPFLNSRKYKVDCGAYDYSSTSSGVTAGVGISAQYMVTDRLSLRGDFDVLGGYARFLSAGVQFRF